MTNEIKEIADKNKVDAIVNDSFNYVCVDKPKSLEEAAKNANFWEDVLEEFNEGVEQIGFVYQEKDKKIPLSYMESLFNKIGFNINQKTEPGKMGYEQVKFELIRWPKNSAVNLITKEDEWKRLNEVSKNSKTFSASFAMLHENLCYQINIPLEYIVEARFKSGCLNEGDGK